MNQNCNRIISIEFLFIVENKLFWFRRSYSSLYSSSSLFTFTADFLKSPIQKKHHKFLPYTALSVFCLI